MLKSVFAVLVGLLACGAEGSSQLYAGTSKVDITPVEEVLIVPKGGCGFRLPDNDKGEKAPLKKVLDPIGARVVVLKNETTSLAIVSLDLAIFSSEKVIRDAKAKWKLDHVILSSTHTHSSMIPRGCCPTPQGWGAWEGMQDDPAVLVDWPAFSEDPWYAATEAKVLEAIGDALNHLFPAKIVAGKGTFESAYMAHNRRLVGPDGHVTMLWDNPNRLPTKPVDPTVGVIQVSDAAGKPRAFMVHYSCHPVGLMDTGVISRDFPGAMCDYIEKELGDECMAMFLQGAQGDTDPYDMRHQGEHAFNLMRQAGISLGKAALCVAKNFNPPKNNTGTTIKVKEDLVKIPLRKGNKVTEIGIMTLVINNELALVTIPGEPFIQHQLDLAQQSPVALTFMLGLAYCGMGTPYGGYIPTVQAAKEGGYGAIENSFVAPEVGETLVKRAVDSLKELKLK